MKKGDKVREIGDTLTGTIVYIANGYADVKYSLLQMFLIPTEEQKDPDSTTPEETDFLAMALQEVRSSLSIETLQVVWGNYKELQSDKRFVEAVTRRKGELK